MNIEVEYTLEFKRNIRQLIKKYHSIRKDIEPIIESLQQGELLGDRIQHSGYVIYKLRVKNSDNRKGKSAGYRVIYYLKTAANIVLVTIYSKSEQSDITANELKRVIQQFNTTNF